MRFELTERDRHVVQMVSMLSQVSTFHLKALLFSDVHRISMDRSLKRLREQKLIRKVGVRAVAYKGGTAPAVYSLGSRGWHFVRRSGKYPGVGSIQEHTLTIADIYVALVDHERTGVIKLRPESGVEFTLDGLRADLYLDLAVPAINKRRRFFVEVQRNARKDIITGKMDAHYRASMASDGRWPTVAFVSQDDWIVSEIKRQIPTERRGLFTSLTVEEFVRECVSETVRAEVQVS